MNRSENNIIHQSEIARLHAELKTKDDQINQLTTQVLGLENTIQQLREEVAFDPLTGLYRRKYFEKRVAEEFSQLKEPKEERRKESSAKDGSVIFFDIDNFKRINDEINHSEGDRVLKTVAKIIQKKIRRGDIPCRWGGDEMAIYLIGAHEEEAAERAEEIKTAIKEKGVYTASIGVAAFEQGISPEQLIYRADSALYKAKTNGKNRVERFSQFTPEDHAKYGKTFC